MLKNYLKTTFRNLLRHKSYAAINISGLALGLAACWLIILFVADELSYDRYHKQSDRIVRLIQHARWNNNDIHTPYISAPFASALKADFPEIREAVRVLPEGGSIVSVKDGQPNKAGILFTDKNIFSVFSYTFLQGDANTALAQPGSIVLTETLARQLFREPQQALGKTVLIDNNEPASVTGVIKDVPANSHLLFSALRAMPAQYTGGWQQFELFTYLLLKPGTSIAALENKLPAFAKRTIQKEMGVEDYKLTLQPLKDIHLHPDLSNSPGANSTVNRIYMFIAIALVILLIAMINYMNLSTARASTRVREVGVRKAIGSGRRELALMFIMEAMMIAVIASVIATTIVQLSLPAFNTLTGKTLSIWRFGALYTVLLIVLFTVLTGCVSGLYPALFLARFNTVPALKGHIGKLSTNALIRRSLVTFQFAVTVVMIAASIIIYQQLQFALHMDLGFNKDQVLTFHVHAQEARKQTAALKARLLQSPAVEAAAVAGNPIGNNDIGGQGFRFETADGSFTTATTMAQELMIDEDYLPTMQIKLLQGRNFTSSPADLYGSAMINETLMKKLGLKDALGKKIQFPQGERTIIGVIKDIHTYSIQHTVEPMVLMMPPVAAMRDNIYVRLHQGKIKQGLAWLNSVYHEFDKTMSTEFYFLDDNFARQYDTEQRQGELTLIFTVLAISIACLGLLGLAIFSTAQRTKEIGVRKVLGASVSSITGMLAADFLKLVLIAAVVAFPLAWVLMRQWLQGFAYRVDVQWWVLLLAGLIAVLIALTTVISQALRAATANPAKSLRME